MSTPAMLMLMGLLGLGGGPHAATARPQCDGPTVDPWVTDLRDRVLTYGALARFAVDVYGAPTGCEGAVDTEFDGARYGHVRLTFERGASLEVVTMPPETSITTLSASSGFENEAEARAALEGAAAAIGLSIDWSAPEVEVDGVETVHTFWDPEPGLNASAALVYRDQTLVGLRLAMAP